MKNTMWNQEGPLWGDIRNIIGLLPIYQHSYATGHYISEDSFSIVGMEAHRIARTIKEAIFISGEVPAAPHLA